MGRHSSRCQIVDWACEFNRLACVAFGSSRLTDGPKSNTFKRIRIADKTAVRNGAGCRRRAHPRTPRLVLTHAHPRSNPAALARSW
jgi:hypothetical protein